MTNNNQHHIKLHYYGHQKLHNLVLKFLLQLFQKLSPFKITYDSYVVLLIC